MTSLSLPALKTMAVAKISRIYLKKHRFWNFGTCIYLKYAVLASKKSSWVKTDPSILTGFKKCSWSQNLKSLAQKTKIWHNYVFSRRFGKYSFHNQTDISYYSHHSLMGIREVCLSCPCVFCFMLKWPSKFLRSIFFENLRFL